MAVELNIDDVVEVRLEFLDNNSSRAFNILHYRLDNVSVAGGGEFPGIGFEVVAAALAEEAFDQFNPSWANAASEQVSMTGVSVQNVYPLPRSARFVHVPIAPVPGINADVALPLQDSPTILKRTAFGARWGVGRLYFVGLGDGYQEGGLVTEAGIPFLNAFANEMAQVITFTDGIFTFNFVPTLLGNTDPLTGLRRVTTIVSVNLSDPVIKTQRSRRPGKGI